MKDMLEALKEKVPQHFLQRELDDLGCGDGRITLILKEIFQPRTLRAFDVNTSLVKRARNRGIPAEVCDLENNLPGGELAVLWGVLHHLCDAENCIQKINSNYHMAFIREPIKDKLIKGWEMGDPIDKEKM